MKERRQIADPYRLVGITLGGKYHLESVLGIGGMGIVYLAHHSAINRKVAVKILKPDLAVNDASVVESFRREAIVSGGLVHSNIINVTDADVTPDGLAYMVMELIEWPTLEEVLVGQPILELARTDRILSQICSALSHAHGLKIVHRDLKPANIALVNAGQPNEQVKVLDFGIAKSLADNVGQVSQAIGTPLYASPEQFTHGAMIDERADIYSLGVITYQLLTGKLPFRGKTVGEIITLHLTQSPPSLRVHQPLIPVQLESFVLGVLSKSAEHRPRSAMDFLGQFREAARSYGLVTGPLPSGVSDTVGQVSPHTLGVTLTGQPVTLSVVGAPPNAEVKINDWSRGRTDDNGRLVVGNLSAGNHVVEVRKTGFQPWKMTLTCAPGENREVTAGCAPVSPAPQVGGDSRFVNTMIPGTPPTWNPPPQPLASTQPGVTQQPSYQMAHQTSYPPPAPPATRPDPFRQNLLVGGIILGLLLLAGGVYVVKTKYGRPIMDPVITGTTSPVQKPTGPGRAEYLDRFEQISLKVHRTIEPLVPSGSNNEADRITEARSLILLSPGLIEQHRKELTVAEAEMAQAQKSLSGLTPPDSVGSAHAQLMVRYREMEDCLHSYEVSLRDLQNAFTGLSQGTQEKVDEHTAESERVAVKRDRERLRTTWEDVRRTEARVRTEIQK